MRRVLFPAALVLSLVLSLPPRALAGPGAPETVATIAPVHSLVARVMQGAGAPRLLIPPNASPHGYSLRPSDAAALDRADVVFRVGPGIEGWLEGALGTLAGDARIVRLDAVQGLTRLPLGSGDGTGAHRDEAAHEHARGPDGAIDPHLWLDPENAKLWLGAIAKALGAADPANRARYAANAEAARGEIDALEAEIADRLGPLRGRPFVVFHDAYRYFGHRFGIEAAAAVTPSDARTPGPARISGVREVIRESDAVCVFREPQSRTTLVETVVEGTAARIGVLDPIGAILGPGPGLYPALLRGLAEGLADCLG